MKITPMDVNPPLYIKVKRTKKADSCDAVIFIIFIIGLIIAAFSM